MIQSIKTSEANKVVVKELTTKLGMGAENLIARLAFAYSISQGKKLDISEITDSKGKEYSSKVLFGDYLPQYIAIVCQFYNLYKTDADISKYIKMHIDDGLNLIDKICKENPRLSITDFIFEQINDGIHQII